MADPKPSFLVRLAARQVDRAETMVHEYNHLEQMGAAQAHLVVDEWARLTQAAITYGFELNSQCRKLTIEALRRLLPHQG
jgi:hypothetical protein